jgi:hypothetical protein
MGKRKKERLTRRCIQRPSGVAELARSVKRMTFLIPRILIVGGWIAIQPIAIAQEQVRSFRDRTEYVFKVETSASDHWNQIKDENPPLSISKAVKAAVFFMGGHPPENIEDKWTLKEVRLRPGNRLREEWFYVVSFYLERGNPTAIGIQQWFDVPVLMDASIPEPTITKRK